MAQENKWARDGTLYHTQVLLSILYEHSRYQIWASLKILKPLPWWIWRENYRRKTKTTLTTFRSHEQKDLFFLKYYIWVTNQCFKTLWIPNYLPYVITLWFFNTTLHSVSLGRGGLFKTVYHCRGCSLKLPWPHRVSPSVSYRWGLKAFLTSSHVILTLLIQNPHIENCQSVWFYFQ